MSTEVCQSAIAVEDFNPTGNIVEPPPGEVLVYKRGDTLLVTKQVPGWVYGAKGSTAGWIPISSVHIFPQRGVSRPESPVDTNSSLDFSTLSLSSRKLSEHSTSTADAVEPAEMQPELADEVHTYTVVETAQHSAIWVPYCHQGSVVYLDTKSKVMSRFLPLITLDDSEPEPIIPLPAEIKDNFSDVLESKIQSISAVSKTQPCLYKNNDFYRVLRQISRPTGTPLKSLWTRISNASPTVMYPTWPELMDGFMIAVEAARRVQDLIPSTKEEKATALEAVQHITAHIKAICCAAHVPPGTNPCLGLGAIAAAYRLMIHSVYEVHVNNVRGLKLGSLDDLSHSTIDFVTLFHLTSGYPAVEVLPLPPIVQVSVLETEWTDYLFDVDPITAEISLSSAVDKLLSVKQAMPLEASVSQDGICATILHDIEDKRDHLEESVNSCISLWNEICEEGLKQRNGLQESSVSLFSSLHAVMSIYKSIVHLIDCSELCQFIDCARPRLGDLSLLIRVRKEVYRSLLTIENSWAKPQRSLCVTDEYSSALRLVPLLFKTIDNFPKMLQGVLPSVQLERWKVVPERQAECIYDSQGHLRGATKEKLVEHLTQHIQPRPNEVSAFLMTFPAFMKHLELVDLLQDRFSVQPDAGLSRTEFRDWEVHVQRPTRLRVVNMLRMWIESYWSHPDTEEEEQQLFHRLEMLLRVLEVQEFPGSQRLHELLMRRRSSGASSIVRKSSSTQPVLDPILPSFSIDELVTPTQLSPTELARQMTLVEWVYFADITPEDCLNRALERPARNTAITDFVTHWNKATCWVSQKVLEGDTPDKRALRIAYFVETASFCRSIKNFSTMMSILSALSSAGIHRLHKTWALVSKQTKESLEEMNRLMNSSRNFQEYRDLLSLVSEAAVPFFGVCLMDLRFAQDGNSDHIHGDDKLINFAKWSMVAGIIESTLRFQRMSYRLAPLHKVTELLHEAFDQAPSLNDQYPVSLEREVRLDGKRPQLISRISSRG